MAQDKLDELTRLLCEACGKIFGGVTAKASSELTHWWNLHQAKDKARLAEEQRQLDLEATRRIARLKLTAKERQALGI